MFSLLCSSVYCSSKDVFVYVSARVCCRYPLEQTQTDYRDYRTGQDEITASTQQQFDNLQLGGCTQAAGLYFET